MTFNKFFFCLLAVLYCLDIAAIPVRHPQTTFIQPDGTSIVVYHYGDEWMHWSTTADGAAVTKGENGYLCYVRFDAEGRGYSTEVPVAPGAPSDVIAAARNIPFQAMRYRAAARRNPLSYIWDGRPNLIRRLNAQHPMTKAGDPIVKHGIIILAEFSGTSFKYDKAAFDEIINGSGDATAMAYFNDQFGGRYDFQFDVFGPVPLPNNCKYYGENEGGVRGNDKRPEQMVIDACDYLKSTVDFSKYDDDGDGEIDNVFIFFSGKDEADDDVNNADCIWSHQWYVRDGAGVTKYYNGKLLNNYACTSELMLSMTTGTYRMASIGTFCHEYTHTFGVPDFYDTNYEGTGGTADAWWHSLGLMCAANSNNDGHTPPNYNAVERECLDLGEPVLLQEGSYTIDPIQESGRYYRIDGDFEGEYYLLECRNNQGWDAYLQGSGMLIYHIDKSNRRTGVDDDGKSCTALARWEGLNMVNAWPDHQCADLVEANSAIVGKYASVSSYSALYRMEKQCFWPYNNVNSFSVNSDPAFTFWSGNGSSFALTDITRTSDGKISFKVVGGQAPITPPTVQNVTKTVFQDAAIISWESSDPAFEGKGYLRYGQDLKNLKEVAVEAYEPGKYACVLDGLTPMTAYKVQLLFKLDGVEGTIDSSANFTTGNYKKNSYPYIWLESAARSSDGVITKGSKIPLRLRNSVGATRIRWFFNGSSIALGKDGWYVLNRDGVLSAEIEAEDGTVDIVFKKIVVR